MEGYGFIHWASEMQDVKFFLIGMFTIVAVWSSLLIIRRWKKKQDQVSFGITSYTLSIICPACDAKNPIDSVFCRMCATPLFDRDDNHFTLYAENGDEDDEEETYENGQNGP